MRSIEVAAGSPGPSRRSRQSKVCGTNRSVLNNVETFANIAPIILKGAGMVRQQPAPEKSKGTKVFALGRRHSARRPGGSAHRVQLGEISLRDRRGRPRGKEFKGRSSSEVLPADASPRAT